MLSPNQSKRISIKIIKRILKAKPLSTLLFPENG